MKPKTSPITTFHIWNKAFVASRKNLKPALILIGVAVIIPNFLAHLLFSKLSIPVANDIRQTVDTFISQNSSSNYHLLFDSTSRYIIFYIMSNCVLGLLTIATYLSIAIISVNLYHYRTIHDLPKLFFLSLRLSMSKGLVLFFGLMILSTEAVLWGPLKILTLSGLIAVVITLVEKRSALSSLWKALLFKYVSREHSRGLSAIVIIISTSALLYLYEATFLFLSDNILRLDEWLRISRDLWVIQVPFMPFNYMYLFSYLFQLVGYSMLLVFLPHFCTSLFFAVRKRLSERA